MPSAGDVFFFHSYPTYPSRESRGQQIFLEQSRCDLNMVRSLCAREIKYSEFGNSTLVEPTSATFALAGFADEILDPPQSLL